METNNNVTVTLLRMQGDVREEEQDNFLKYVWEEEQNNFLREDYSYVGGKKRKLAKQT